MLKTVLSLFISVILSIFMFVVIQHALLTASVMFYEEGCKDAGLKLKQDYGSQYQAYMDRFCDARIKMIKNEFKIEE